MIPEAWGHESIYRYIMIHNVTLSLHFSGNIKNKMTSLSFTCETLKDICVGLNLIIWHVFNHVFMNIVTA